MKKYFFAAVFGTGGTAILLSLCFWQLQRLEWKEALIAGIEEMARAEPVALPEQVTEQTDRFRAVSVTGELSQEAIHVLTSLPARGPGYRVVSPLELEQGGRVMIDRGFLAQSAKNDPLASGQMTITGNLDWPQETDSFTPDPDIAKNIWFARDVEAMAAQLNTAPVLIVASSATGDPSPYPMPVSINLRNNHLEYAITWGLLALVWLAMTAYLVIRIRRNTA